jgi:hypothetical protein
MEAPLTMNDRFTWCDLGPGTSTQTLREKLGAPDEIEELTNGKIYHFAGGTIQATVLNNSSQVRKLLIINQALSAPKTLDQFQKQFGPIAEKKCDKLDGITYERPGVRVVTEISGDPPEIRWIEIF